MKIFRKKKGVFVAMAVAFALSLSVVSIARAILTDTEYSFGNTIKGATINLKVGDTDPGTLAFSFDNIMPGITQQIFTDVSNAGSLEGNFWMEVSTSNSLEMENPEPETDTIGKGELEDCAELKIIFDVGAVDPIILLPYTTVSAVTMDLDRANKTLLDAKIEAGAEMNLQLITNACGNEAMGDAFDLDLTFHYDQT